MICKSGIYKIINKVDEKYYYGSSNNMSVRWSGHKNCVKSGSNKLPKLYSAMKKYGTKNFEIIPIIICEIDDLEYYEQYFLDKCVGLDECYNVSKNAKSPMRNASKETLQKLGKAISKAKKGSIPWNKGIPRSENTKNKIKKTLTNNNFTDDDIINIRKKYSTTDIKLKDLAEKYNCSYGIIRRIIHGITYDHLPVFDNNKKPIISSWNKGLTNKNNKKWSDVCESISISKKGKLTGRMVKWTTHKCKNPKCNIKIECQPSQVGHKKYCSNVCKQQHKEYIKIKKSEDFIISNCYKCEAKIKTYRQKCGKLIPRKVCDDCKNIKQEIN